VISLQVSAQLQATCCRLGANVTRHVYSGADHDGVLDAAQNDASSGVGDRFAGHSVKSGCGKDAAQSQADRTSLVAGVGQKVGLGPDVSATAEDLPVSLAGIPVAGAKQLSGPRLASTWLTAAADIEGDQLDEGRRQDMSTGVADASGRLAVERDFQVWQGGLNRR
jgi:hypothetical protein